MAASNAGNTDSLPTNEIEMEKSQQYASPNKWDSNGAMNGDPGSVDKSADAKNSRNIIRGFCTERNCLIAIIVLLAVIVAGLCVYVGILHLGLSGRLDRLETRCNSICTSSINKTQMNSELEESDGDLPAQISHLSKTIEGLKESLSSLEKTHRNDTNEIRTSTSTMLTQINTSLSNSLLSFTNEAALNISKLNKVVQMDISSVRNHSLMLAQNVSVLADRMSFLERRSYKLERNATELQDKITRVMMNVSSNGGQLRDLFSTQAEHATTIEWIQRNASLLEDHFAQQLTEVRENFTDALSAINSSLSVIDTNHRAHLRNLSSGLNSLNSELAATKKAFFANISALDEKLAEFGEDLARTDEHLTNLSSIQEDLLLDLADVKAAHSSNLSSIGQSLADLNEEFTETYESVQNLSSIQITLQRDLSHINEAFQSNITSLEQIFNGEINLTRIQLQNLSSQQTELEFNLAATRNTLEANTSALQGSLRLVEGNLNLTKAELRNLSLQHFNLQRDYEASRVAIEQNTSLLFEHIHNHSSILGEHSRLLGEAVRNESVLRRRIDDALNLVSSQGQLITGIRSNVSVVENGLTDLRGTLTTKVGHLNTRIDDHVHWIQHTLDDQSQRLSDLDNTLDDQSQRLSNLDNTLDDQSQRLSNLDNHISRVESKLLSDAIHVVPLGLLLLSAISLFACFVIL